MRIDALAQVQQLYSPKKTTKVQQTGGTSFRDNLQISSIGKDIQTAKQAVVNSPDVREDVIAPIKAQIANGTYEVSGDSFADKLLEKLGTM